MGWQGPPDERCHVTCDAYIGIAATHDVRGRGGKRRRLVSVWIIN